MRGIELQPEMRLELRMYPDKKTDPEYGQMAEKRFSNRTEKQECIMSEQNGEPVSETGWLWVLIQEKDGKEQIVGQYFKEDDISFIPAFEEKEYARRCQGKMILEEGMKYELQAMHINDLKMQAGAGGFQIFLLNGVGEILRRISP
ncbi:MAG: hypothetical protein AB7S75_07905 [Desulfococcaceae bacterium]